MRGSCHWCFNNLKEAYIVQSMCLPTFIKVVFLLKLSQLSTANVPDLSCHSQYVWKVPCETENSLGGL